MHAWCAPFIYCAAFYKERFENSKAQATIALSSGVVTQKHSSYFEFLKYIASCKKADTALWRLTAAGNRRRVISWVALWQEHVCMYMHISKCSEFALHPPSSGCKIYFCCTLHVAAKIFNFSLVLLFLSLSPASAYSCNCLMKSQQALKASR